MLDRFGCELTAAGAGAASALERTILAIAAHRRDAPQHLARALDEDPGLCLAHCLRGYALRFLARRELLPQARAALADAEASLAERGGSERERRLCAGLAALCEGDSARTARELSIVLAHEPHDLLALKLDHAVRFMRGDTAGMRTSAERALAVWSPSDSGYGYALGMLAFAREETGDCEGAERAGREALEHAPDDAWGAHALAHVHEMRDRPREGARWLERCREAGVYAACNNFGGHVAWHLALFYVQLGEHARALELYDEVVEQPPGDFRDVSNASSLLFRLEDDGVAVGTRWSALAERAAPLSLDHGYAFADVHYALALMRGGRRTEARALLASLRRHALGERSPDARVVRELGLPLVEGVLALEEGRAHEAFEHLAIAADGAPLLGGSHAQRDLFRRLWIAAARGCDRDALARASRAYLEARPDNAWAAALVDRSARRAAPAE